MNDEHYMQMALNLASSVSGQTGPNPPVGAVVVRNGEILGVGAHLKAGEPHAEAHALQMAGDKAKGATIYVTLEPCSHHGKTPPCADLIIEKGLSRAVIAIKDPNEKVAGRGIEKLKAAGVDVESGVLLKEAAAVNKHFFHYTRTKTPYVTMKSAVSLDGKTATHTGDSKWVTGEAARRDVHQYRHTHDAILAGVNTVLADNPSLTARIPNGGRNPLRIILDSNLRTPTDANVVNDRQADTWIITGDHISEVSMKPFEEKNSVTIIPLNSLDPVTVLNYLGSRKIMSLFVEGGASVNGSFLESGKINQLVQYMAPKLIGGKDAPSSIAGNGFKHLTETLSLYITNVEMIGEDIKIIAEPRKGDTNVYGDN
ncbi:bifunctional diaminohydroxyphosphoribosylaminopyrimidine deaminase/5-amino-6-(5-phosphoribosylamino)uracil reductase RibD [Lentibacillus sp. CBA3610]|uniref:bifunctional diaminohydroxyphosphoribosylaminopyrimidine deaminase/5-amino-6-(5-phosphoribosylamino)uracil reductase RibD n=1 Tax=Lentibacillus sp. CBA3610 TaxID=2518176 RepID=UPI001595E2B0|nr:bifunctional diaminohydroxyphosphoribosylaminopyrimidine deaminase/5-amino-6-(5-phosphoribosylamino)uracil reductase RibD [Lentibacillus sp. CBA3610]QKY71508.1 bifunctional diaminohydroxyphosphoribosylaminopyrimidine deaminase/5-amino-6-(5-phosphoribosylamino)uracil reductase RibD [Lentibacillus sp. CBA3610]